MAKMKYIERGDVVRIGLQREPAMVLKVEGDLITVAAETQNKVVRRADLFPYWDKKSNLK